MITYRVFNINYSIEPEDIIYINEDDYALRSDYIQACEDEVNSIIDDLPTEIEVKIASTTCRRLKPKASNSQATSSGMSR